jgi:hypothetical protein
MFRFRIKLLANLILSNCKQLQETRIFPKLKSRRHTNVYKRHKVDSTCQMIKNTSRSIDGDVSKVRFDSGFGS